MQTSPGQRGTGQASASEPSRARPRPSSASQGPPLGRWGRVGSLSRAQEPPGEVELWLCVLTGAGAPGPTGSTLRGARRPPGARSVPTASSTPEWSPLPPTRGPASSAHALGSQRPEEPGPQATNSQTARDPVRTKGSPSSPPAVPVPAVGGVPLLPRPPVSPGERCLQTHPRGRGGLSRAPVTWLNGNRAPGRASGQRGPPHMRSWGTPRRSKKGQPGRGPPASVSPAL